MTMLRINKFFINHENLKPYHYAIINDLAEFNEQRQQQVLQKQYLLGLSNLRRKGLLLGLSIVGKLFELFKLLLINILY